MKERPKKGGEGRLEVHNESMIDGKIEERERGSKNIVHNHKP